MRMIKRICNEMRGNVQEAREKICTAYTLREKSKDIADWYKEMAAVHLQFNTTGVSILAKMVAEAKAKAPSDPLAPGMLAVYDDMRADIACDAAEVQAMVQNYK